MGVKGLAAWLQSTYPEAFSSLPRSLPGRSYDHVRAACRMYIFSKAGADCLCGCQVYVDMPGLFHQTLRRGTPGLLHELRCAAC